ncbi:nuclear transport factor 2 family protein [Moheibacter lacus]|uniref:Nuclear transport factor 2 family protein n=1 Tax=Moheibacter lacus TaxID=2745851 RepID=A0A838ZPA6_9FLAO|nr:nuclear transport factor 2 family protein [Moheibacter lacus]MBA5629890.1 nuclear transport factor 2 family protein [Moheibacter lacus]
MNKLKSLIIILLTNSLVLAQEIHQTNPNAAPSIVWAMSSELDDALLEKDTASLRKLLHKDLILGHSNGWWETKVSLLKNLPTQKIRYQEFRTVGEPEIHHASENLKTITRKLTAIGELDDYDFEVDLKIIEIWIYENERWQLLARQSVEVEFDE